MLVSLVSLALLRTAHATTCDGYGPAETVVEFQGGIEASGLAASVTRDGVFFTHGDNGDEPTLASFDHSGLLGWHRLDVPNQDWEDLAAAPCPDRGDCLYVGDIGDNDGDGTTVTVYAVREPGEQDDRLQTVASWTATYPDGAHDAETLLVHPCTGALSVVTKNNGPATVYRFPLEEGGALESVATVVLDQEITGGAWDPDGERVVLRTKDRVLVWDADPEQPNAHWASEPVELTAATERTGEGVTIGPDGHVYSLGTEAPILLTRYPCASAAAAAGECVFPQTGGGCGGCGGGSPGGVLGLLLVLAGWVAGRPSGRGNRRGAEDAE